jgi:phosphatidylinositol dimannoside acyltransferase
VASRISGWLTATLAIGGARLLSVLPERLLWGIGIVAGEVTYRASRPRRDRARRNLRRIVTWMAERGAGEERYRAAASDPRALERLVRSAFRQHAHYNFEMIRAPRFDARYVAERLVIETPDEVERYLSERRALILLGMHLGAIEMPGFYAVHRLGVVVAPMESVPNPRIQRWVFSTRAKVGVRIVGLEDARELVATLRRNEPVGLVADRDITGGGIEADLFGAPTRIPAGPAFLAVETGAPIYAATVRRTGPGRYRGSLCALPVPEGATSRKERIRGLLREEARVFEHFIAEAPDQWLAVFHPIWPDLEPAAGQPAGRRPGPGTTE